MQWQHAYESIKQTSLKRQAASLWADPTPSTTPSPRKVQKQQSQQKYQQENVEVESSALLQSMGVVYAGSTGTKSTHHATADGLEDGVGIAQRLWQGK
jgi:hypothetical protein